MSRDHNLDFINDVKPLLSNCVCRFSDLPSGIANADSISLNKTVDFPLLGLNLYGKSTQGYASHGGIPLGKNLLDTRLAYDTLDSITFVLNTDKTITANGISSNTTPDINRIGVVKLKAGVSYLISGCPTGGSDQSYRLDLRLNDVGYTYLNIADYGSGALYTPIQDEEVQMCIRWAAGVNFENITFKPMLRLASETDDTYEPYYSAPNPDCPVPVENVGDDGEVSVTACGKNLFDFEAWKKVTTFATGGTLEYVDNGLTLTTTDNSSSCFTGTYKGTGKIAVKPNTIYTLSWNRVNKTKGQVYLFYNGDTTKFAVANNRHTDTLTFTTEADTTYVVLRFDIQAANTTETYSNIQFEKGTATDYEPYTGSTATLTSALPLCGLPVQSGGNYTDSNGQQWVCDELIYNSDGTGKVVKKTGGLTISSSNTMVAVNAYEASPVQQYNVTVPALNCASMAKSMCNILPRNEGVIGGGVLGHLIHRNTVVVLTLPKSLLAEYGYIFSDSSTYVPAIKDYMANNPIQIKYELAAPEEINLTAEEMAQLYKLYSHDGVTNVFNDEGAEMSISACTNPVLAAEALPIIKRLESQAAATQTTTTETETETV